MKRRTTRTRRVLNAVAALWASLPTPCGFAVVLAVLILVALAACASPQFSTVCVEGVLYTVGADGSMGLEVTDDLQPVRCP